MFSYEERIKAVKLLLQYDKSYATVIRELGYPSKRALTNWYEEYIKNGDLHKDFIKKPKYSDEDRRKAVDYYLEHGRCVSRTVKALGYPSRPELDKWINELNPEKKHHCRSGGSLVKYTHEQKEQAVISLCSRSKPAKQVATEIGVTREVLYNWKRQLLSKGYDRPMPKKLKTLKNSGDTECEVKSTDLLAEKIRLEKEVNELQKEIYRLQLERDILETAAEVIKKRPGH
ncbi:MAG: transposase [Lutisporaceae bacterium]